MKFLAVQERRTVFLRCPKLVAYRIKNHPENNLALKTQRNRDAKMRDAVEEIDSAIERIDDPLMIA